MARPLVETETLLTEALEVIGAHMCAHDERWRAIVGAIAASDDQGLNLKLEEMEQQALASFHGEPDDMALLRSYLALREAIGSLQEYNDAAISGAMVVEGRESTRAVEPSVGFAGGDANRAPSRSKRRRHRRHGEPRRYDVSGGVAGQSGAGPGAARDVQAVVSPHDGVVGAGSGGGDPMRRSLKERLDQLDLRSPDAGQARVADAEQPTVAAGPGREPTEHVPKATREAASVPREAGRWTHVARTRYLGDEASVEIVRKPRPATGNGR